MSEPGFSAGLTPRFDRLVLTNFLSYKSAEMNFGNFIALVGTNAAGKSNAVAAIKLLREIPVHGLPTAIARRGGFDQLRHRSAGRPYDPALRIEFTLDGGKPSFYELRLGAVAGKRYEVKSESAVVHWVGDKFSFKSDGRKVVWSETDSQEPANENEPAREFVVPPGQSAISSGSGFAGYLIFNVLQRMQTVEINPNKVGELQEPSSTREFEPDGSNTTSIYETLAPAARSELIDELSAIVPGISRIEVEALADMRTLVFRQQTAAGNREFYAKQMSDGTLRAFGVLLATHQSDAPGLLVIEEPEIAIHLGALRTLVEILQQQSEQTQIVITTHSADIVDSLPIEDLRVVTNDGGSSRIAPVAEHTRGPVRAGLVTPGQLLRANALDPAAQ